MKLKMPKIDVKKGFGVAKMALTNNAPELCIAGSLLAFGFAIWTSSKAAQKCQQEIDAAILKKNEEFFKQQAAAQCDDVDDYDEPDYGDEPTIDIIEDEYSDKTAKHEKEVEIPADFNDLTKKEKLVIYGKNYILTILLYGLGTAGVLTALKLKNNKIKAAMVAASMAEAAYANKGNAIKSILTPKQVSDVEMAENEAMLENNKAPDDSIIERSAILGDTLFYEPLMRRYFYSDIDGIRIAICDAKEQLLDTGGITLNDYCCQLGIKTIPEYGDDIAWNYDRTGNIKATLQYDPKVNGRPTVVIKHEHMPESINKSFHKSY